MNIYETNDVDNIAEDFMKMLEKETGKDIFTMRLLDEGEGNSELDALVIFTDQSILMGRIIAVDVNGALALRIQASFI